jgi:DNA-binding winged helix-turn-helix (wHTH) protein
VASGSFAFDQFVLDPTDRRLHRGGETVELNSRYLDALALLVREQGSLVSKQRFLDEVWNGVPVTDEALTQCIKTLRRQLGDDASRPRFIETVPKHGYRFIAAVESVGGRPVPRTAPIREPVREAVLSGLAGTVGGGIAGFVGGLFYGLAGATHPLQPGMGAASVLLVLLSLTILVALIGGAGVSFGIAAAGYFAGPRSKWLVAGGALGGLVVGAFTKLLGLDAFTLLFGRAPGDITGAMEGVVLGAAIGLGAWIASLGYSVRRSAVIAAGTGGAAGFLVPFLGGRLMGGSLDLLAHHFPGSRLRLDQISGLFGEADFGFVTQVVTAALEGALFSACVVGAIRLAQRSLD